MTANELQELTALAQQLAPTCEGRVLMELGNPISREWEFPFPINLDQFLAKALQLGPVSCFPIVTTEDNVIGVRVVVGTPPRVKSRWASC